MSLKEIKARHESGDLVVGPLDTSQYHKDRAELIRIVEQLQAQVDALQWQPIETAPKDGTRVLVCADIWMWDRTIDKEVTAPQTLIAEWRDREWAVDDWNYDCCGCSPETVKPAHWMPLPEPPQALKEQKP